MKAAFYCPTCEWFKIASVSGDLDICGDCGAVLRERLLTADELRLTEEWNEGVSEEAPRQKGNKNENEARRILDRAYSAAKVSEYGIHDPFGIVDIMAVKPGRKPKFVQVKTNRFADRKKYRKEAARRIPEEYIDFEVWVRVDREGWKIYEWDGAEFELAFESHSCDEAEIVRKWREHETGEVETRELTMTLDEYAPE